MYSPYQKPKRCWKCSGNKIWNPQNNKWMCPHCDNPPQMYPPQAYPPQAYPPQAYPPQAYPQYGYSARQPMYRGPPARTYSRQAALTYQPTSAPTYPMQVAPTYQPTPISQYMAPVGNKLCNYCGATMKEDEVMCPKCLQRVLMV